MDTFEFDLPPVREVCLWALFSCSVLAVGSILLLLIVASSDVLHSSYYLTPVEAAEVGVLLQYLLWCGAEGAIAAALALLLLTSRARRALAGVVLAAAAATHWKMVRGIEVALAASGLQRFNGALAIMATFFGATVLLNFVGIFLGEDE